ncbi:unnamed protein product [Ectocarpus sp. CCAP 1310/34]|nr:unnamed protein product [Ectocarpus sp. CCAP 1310/34]
MRACVELWPLISGDGPLATRCCY